MTTCNINKQLSETVKVKQTLSKQQKEAYKIISTTKQNLFIQGQAGTGKSTFIQYLKSHLTKNMVICSPTAVAALNVGGMTLHNFFKLPPCDYLTDEMLWKRNRKQIADVIHNMELLVIDEVSMVRPDMLDGIDKLLKSLKKSKKPFGGTQILLIGDLYQLPPIIKSNVSEIFLTQYGTSDVYFFDAESYKNGNFIKIEFNKIYRQASISFINKLNNLRNNKDLKESINYFNKCKIEDNNILNEATTITPYVKKATEINLKKLEEIKTLKHVYKSTKEGSFLEAKETAYPAPDELILKEGALVMFNKNHCPEWINGSTGIIQSLYPDEIYVKLISNGNIVKVEREEWQSKEYETVIEKVKTPKISYIDEDDEPVYEEDENGNWIYETKDVKHIEEKITGTFTQFPLQLGWSVTIHKAQGKTLDKVIVDIDKGAFAHGQLYVALSRTKNKEDIHIATDLHIQDSIISQRVVDFMQDAI